MTIHTPLCLHCVTNEVQAPFTYPDGSGFCSFACETLAHEEAALAHADMGRCAECGGYAATYFPTGEPACRMCWSYEDEEYRDDQLVEIDEARKLADMMADARYDAFLSQYDDNPSVYAGTYSEE